MLSAFVIGFIALALSGYALGAYNGLVRARAAVRLAWSNIDVLLVQRHDELPKLVEVCKLYMQYERDTLERVMLARAHVDAARTAQNLASLGTAERELRSQLAGLYAVAERYPDLKASEPFHHLASRISGLETALSDRREIYNAEANASNVMLASFPGLLLVGFGDFPPARLLHFDVAQTADPDVRALFAGASAPAQSTGVG